MPIENRIYIFYYCAARCFFIRYTGQATKKKTLFFFAASLKQCGTINVIHISSYLPAKLFSSVSFYHCICGHIVKFRTSLAGPAWQVNLNSWLPLLHPVHYISFLFWILNIEIILYPYTGEFDFFTVNNIDVVFFNV